MIIFWSGKLREGVGKLGHVISRPSFARLLLSKLHKWYVWLESMTWSNCCSYSGVAKIGFLVWCMQRNEWGSCRTLLATKANYHYLLLHVCFMFLAYNAEKQQSFKTASCISVCFIMKHQYRTVRSAPPTNVYNCTTVLVQLAID